jgi:hypothetical protein
MIGTIVTLCVLMMLAATPVQARHRKKKATPTPTPTSGVRLMNPRNAPDPRARS